MAMSNAGAGRIRAKIHAERSFDNDHIITKYQSRFTVCGAMGTPRGNTTFDREIVSATI
jgi:hypothetical protein